MTDSLEIELPAGIPVPTRLPKTSSRAGRGGLGQGRDEPFRPLHARRAAQSTRQREPGGADCTSGEAGTHGTAAGREFAATPTCYCSLGVAKWIEIDLGDPAGTRNVYGPSSPPARGSPLAERRSPGRRLSASIARRRCLTRRFRAARIRAIP